MDKKSINNKNSQIGQPAANRTEDPLSDGFKKDSSKSIATA